MSRAPRVVQARVDGGFGSSRRRPIGRIGGSTHTLPPPARAAFVRALGPEASVLEAERVTGQTSGLVADFDACWLGTRRLGQAEDFADLLAPDPDRLGEVDGAFALAWRDALGVVCLARDPIGERSLFYAAVAGGYLFASSVRALLATGLVARTLDLVGLAQYLSCAYVPGDRTLVAGIQAVLPGEIVRLSATGPHTTQYWRAPGEAQMAPLTSADALREDLRARLEAAVRRRLPEHEAPGASLSGGLDSSLVVALARHVSPAPLRTYSLSFGAAYPNELEYSSLVAAHCGTEHTIVEVSPEAVLAHMDAVSATFDRPVGDPLSVPNGLLFRAVSEHVGVLLNGEGGDPCFGGPKNLPMVLAELYGDAQNPLGGTLARERSYLRSHQRLYDDLGALLSPRARAAIGDAIELSYAPLFNDPRWATFINKLMMMNLVLKGGHHILPKVDALSGAFGVRPRSPLFDRHVVDQAFRIPPQLKLRGAVEKYLLKAAVDDLLPRPILDRPKAGMGVPVEAWFRGPLHAYARERLLDGLARYDLFERPYLERLLQKRKSLALRERRGVKIWLLLTLEAWLRRVLDAPTPPVGQSRSP